MDCSAILQEYGTKFGIGFKFLPISAIIASIFLLIANPNYPVMFFLVGSLFTEILNTAGNLLLGKDKISHVVQGYAYILGFVTIVLMRQKKYYGIFATISLSILVFVVEMSSAQSNDWKFPLFFFTYGLGIFVGLIMGHFAMMYIKNDEDNKPTQSVCRAYQDGVLIGKLNTT